MALKAHLCVAEARQVINKKEGDFMIFTEISRLNRINLRPLCKKIETKNI
jgi:bifunctional DNA-binding transcriptional regulator/antitoxin component of YhaV-PrlF toxin-antitoxin module